MGKHIVYPRGMSTAVIDTALAWAKELRGWNQSGLALAVGATPQHITNWKKRGMPTDWHQPVAAALGVTVDELIAGRRATTSRFGLPSIGSGPIGEPAVPYGSGGLRAVPVVGRGMGGVPDRIWGDEGRPTGVTDEFAYLATQDEQAFLVRVEGASMYPRFKPGEFALIEPNTAIELEDDILVRLVSGETMLKRLVGRRDAVLLASYKPDDPVLSYRPEEILWMYYAAHSVPSRKLRSRL